MEAAQQDGNRLMAMNGDIHPESEQGAKSQLRSIIRSITG